MYDHDAAWRRVEAAVVQQVDSRDFFDDVRVALSVLCRGRPTRACVLSLEDVERAERPWQDVDLAHVGRNGDLVVGFLAGDAPVEFDVLIGGETVCRHALVPGQFAYALDGRFTLPIVAWQFSELKLRPFPAGLRVVFACLQTEERRCLARSGASALLDAATGRTALFRHAYHTVASSHADVEGTVRMAPLPPHPANAASEHVGGDAP